VISQGRGGLTAGLALTMSVYLRSNTGSNQTIILYDGNAGPATRTTATVTTSWQRFTFTRTIAGTSFFVRLGSIGDINAGVQDILAWGAQLEVGSVATSYIPTVAATATRNADVISKTGVSGFIGQLEGCLYAEVDLRTINISTAPVSRILAIFDSANPSTQRVIMAVQRTASGLNSIVFFVSNGTTQFSQTITNVNPGINKLAIAYKQNDFAAYLNGQAFTSTSGNVPNLLNNIYLGLSESDAANVLNYRIRAAAIYPTRLSNDELAALTTL
jgi:hypothetical protein